MATPYCRVSSHSPGLRGAIAYALALNLKEKKDVFDPEYVQILNTTTLIIVLFTIVALGGSTLPLLKVVARGLIKVLPTSIYMYVVLVMSATGLNLCTSPTR